MLRRAIGKNLELLAPENPFLAAIVEANPEGRPRAP
jgi:hypothetical protein